MTCAPDGVGERDFVVRETRGGGWYMIEPKGGGERVRVKANELHLLEGVWRKVKADMEKEKRRKDTTIEAEQEVKKKVRPERASVKNDSSPTNYSLTLQYSNSKPKVLVAPGMSLKDILVKEDRKGRTVRTSEDAGEGLYVVLSYNSSGWYKIRR